jgi:phosphate transport system protein
MSAEHIVKSYDGELRNLKEMIARMGSLSEAQLAAAIRAVSDRDSALAARTVEGDAKIDALEQETEKFAVRLLALRQPMARDLREIVAAIKIASDLERIADYAANVAKRAISLVQSQPVRPAHAVPRMALLTQRMIKDVLDAYMNGDAELAIEVWRRDEEVDEMYVSLFRELLTYMMEDARSITPCTHLLFIAKNIERIGDHITNIAENIHYQIDGSALNRARPRGNSALEFDADALPIKGPAGAAKRGAAADRKNTEED